MSIIGVIALVICGTLLAIFCIICFCVFTNNYKLLNMLINDPDNIEFYNKRRR